MREERGRRPHLISPTETTQSAMNKVLHKITNTIPMRRKKYAEFPKEAEKTWTT